MKRRISRRTFIATAAATSAVAYAQPKHAGLVSLLASEPRASGALKTQKPAWMDAGVIDLSTGLKTT